jgi:hypothetical protein
MQNERADLAVARPLFNGLLLRGGDNLGLKKAPKRGLVTRVVS